MRSHERNERWILSLIHAVHRAPKSIQNVKIVTISYVILLFTFFFCVFVPFLSVLCVSWISAVNDKICRVETISCNFHCRLYFFFFFASPFNRCRFHFCCFCLFIIKPAFKFWSEWKCFDAHIHINTRCMLSNFQFVYFFCCCLLLFMFFFFHSDPNRRLFKGHHKLFITKKKYTLFPFFCLFLFVHSSTTLTFSNLWGIFFSLSCD